MKEMTIKQPEAPKIKINGYDFQIRKTDIEILRMVQEAQRKYEGRDISGIDEAVEAARDLVEMIDGILGKGTVDRTRATRPCVFLQDDRRDRAWRR